MAKHHHHHHHHHYGSKRDRDGYAYHAGEPGPGPNYYRLRRSLRDRKIAGVCGGMGEHFGWNVDFLRAGWFFAAVFTFPIPIFAYIFAAMLIKPQDGIERVYEDEEDERFWRTFSRQPRRTFSELKHRFRALDARVSDMESTVTSDDYGLRKAFDDLERDRSS